MLSYISWQHYLAAIIIITATYYLYVALRYYQAEISNLFNRKGQTSDIVPAVESTPISVMGEAKPDSGITLTDTQELNFTAASPDEIETHDVKTTDTLADGETAIKPSAELAQEAGNLIEAFKGIDNKPEFLALLNILIDSYKRFSEDIDLPATLGRVVELSKEKLQFPIALSDLQSNWA